ncbi:MAG TPA: PDZ domain-containing protein [Gemmatimonadaceae bacterium]|nr:PDZ domain-containing protein [Gemmatimonadaceae bacterium]
MRNPAVVVAATVAVVLIAPGAEARGQDVRYTTPSGTMVMSMGNSASGRLGLSVAAGSRRDTLGLLITMLTTDGPAEKAGIIEGDRLVAINGVPLALSAADAGEPDMAMIARRRLERELAKVETGQEVTLRVWSGGRTRDERVPVAEASSERRRSATVSIGGNMVRRGGDWENRPALGISLGGGGSVRDTLGIFVSAVAPGSPAERAGIIEGHRIASINGVDLRVPAVDAGDAQLASVRANRLTREVEKLEPGARAQLRVWSDGRYRDVTVEVGRYGDVFKDSGTTFQLGVPGMFDYMPGGVINLTPMMPGPGRIESLDSLWQRRDELRRSLEPLRRGELGEDIQERLDQLLREMPRVRAGARLTVI